jgi:hypothetical protein
MTESVKAGVFAAFWCVVLAGLVLSGCREQEQGRILIYKKGSYLGLADRKLDADQVKLLRLRTQRQSYN